MDIGSSEAEMFWTAFLHKLARRGLRGVKLVVFDAHEGLKAAISKVLSASWRRCRVHFMRNALAHAGKSGRRVVSAFIATAFAQDDAAAARQQWRSVADQLRPNLAQPLGARSRPGPTSQAGRLRDVRQDLTRSRSRSLSHPVPQEGDLAVQGVLA